MFKLRNWWILGLFLLVVNCGKSSTPISGEIPDLSLSTETGESFALKKKLSQVNLLVFWATWCQPCLMEIPSLISLHQKYQSQGFQVISILVDDPEGDKASTLRKNFEMNYPILLSPDEETLNQFGGIRALPTAFFLDQNGKYLEKLEGLTPEFVLDEKIKTYLKTPSQL